MVDVCMKIMFQANTGHRFGRISFYLFFIIMVWVCSACLHSLRAKRSKGLHPFSGLHGVCEYSCTVLLGFSQDEEKTSSLHKLMCC